MCHRLIKYVLFAFALVSVSVKAQIIDVFSEKLDWIYPTVDAFYSNEDAKLYFSDATYDEQKLPIFSKRVSLKDNEEIDSVWIESISTKPCYFAEKVLLENKNIEDFLVVDFHVVTERKKQVAIISFVPLLKKNNSVEKVISFSLTVRKKEKKSFRVSSTSHLYSESSVLSSGYWIKVSVTQTGIHKINYDDLLLWGISPEHVHVYGYGGAMLSEDFSKEKIDDLPQIPIYMEKGSDGVFNSGDYILFFAQGPIKWNYNESTELFNHVRNPYSEQGFYFITSDVGTDLFISEKLVKNNIPSVTVADFKDYDLHEQELTKVGNPSGRNWFGEVVSSELYNFYFPNLKSESATATVVALSNTPVKSSMRIEINNISDNLDFPKLSGYYKAMLTKGDFSFIPSSDDINVFLSYSNSSSIAWLDYIEMNVTRYLVQNNSQMCFRNPKIVGENVCALYQIQSMSPLQVWDVTIPSNPQKLSVTYDASMVSFVDSAEVLREYVSFVTDGSFPSPQYVSMVENQNLHASSQVDFVIITNEEYWSQANQLALIHEENDNIKTLVVTPQQVYNEFSSGTQDVTAFRWLMKMFYDRASDAKNAPKNLLLFGDGTYDNLLRNKATASVHKLPTFQTEESLATDMKSVGSDDYFAFLDDSEGKNVGYGSMDIGVGRFPVSSIEQADAMVQKVKEYLTFKSDNAWKRNLCYIADDVDDMSSNFSFVWQTDTLVKYIEKKHSEFLPKRMFLDSYTEKILSTGESYPLVHEKLFQMIKNGTLFISFLGHGGTNSITSERILQLSDVSSMRNKNYPIFFAGTCNAGKYDDIETSLAEELVVHKNGGMLAAIAATRTVYASDNYSLIKAFNQNLLYKENGEYLTLGESLRLAKNKSFADVCNNMSYALLGDPAIRLPLPKNKIVVDSVKRISYNEGEFFYLNQSTNIDTLSALSTIIIKGRILNDADALLENFNGKIDALIQDKETSMSTLGNDNMVYNYKDRVNTIFSGVTTVKDGTFTLLFKVPKDINYDYGNGQMLFYATDTIQKNEAKGCFRDFIVGGTENGVVNNFEGPKIDVYLNSPYFKNNDNVDNTSVLYAHFQDEDGINTTGIGIGHELQIEVSGDTSFIVVLNDYYKTQEGSYQKGTVIYTLPNLSNGHYDLTLRAWDLMNNSSSKTISFNVNENKSVAMYKLLPIPNPACVSSDFYFHFEHDNPQSDLILAIEVYSANGSKMWSTSQKIYSEENNLNFPWDLKTPSGCKLNTGVYPYRFSVKTENQAEDWKTGKLIVK